jgi:predicted Zn-dependent protease
VKATQRSVLSTAGLIAAVGAIVAPAVAGAQRVQQPGPDTKRVLVTTFRGDQEGGVKIADEIRNRIAGDFNIKTLMPNSKKEIDGTLVQSGYRPDSALSPNDIRELAKLVRSDEVIDGTVTRTANGYRVSARMFLPRDVSLSQPLLTTESNNLGDVSKQVVREYDAARKQLQATQECENAIRDGKLPLAKEAARRAIAAYPKSTLARLCLASAFQAQKLTADSTGPWKDSVIAVTREATNLDRRSRIAYQLQIDAFKAKNDTANVVPALFGYMASDSTNSALKEQVVTDVVQMGKADLAVPITRQLVADNPGDPQYARLNWLVLRAARNYKESVPAGIAYVTLDTAAADTNYYFRQVADLAADSNYAKAAEFAAQGAARFPKNVSLLIQQAGNQRRAGQLPAAQATLQRALQLDPKAGGANMILAQIANDAGNPDSAVKYVKADVAIDPTNKERDAAYLLTWGNTAYRAAAASKKPEDFQKAVVLLKGSDEINPTPNASFLAGYSAFNLLQQSAADLQKSKSCADAKASSDYLVLVNNGMMKGGSFSPDAAKQILGALPQFQAFVDASVKKYCK